EMIGDAAADAAPGTRDDDDAAVDAVHRHRVQLHRARSYRAPAVVLQRTPPSLTAGSRYSRLMSDSSVVLVTGGGSGIGRATAQLAAQRGASVAVLDRHEAHARETAETIEADGGRALPLTTDVADDD